MGRRRDTGDALRVLVVDDSAVMRQFMSALLCEERGMCARVAADPLIATRKMRDWRPDVILLDLEMPRMDGLSFLRRIMAEDPLPVVILSSHAEKGTEMALQSLEEGAVEVIAKPKLGLRDYLYESAETLLETIRAAAKARPSARRPGLLAPRLTADAVLPANLSKAKGPCGNKIVAIGASTGGPEALRRLLQALPAGFPGIVIVQHMPARFLPAFADRLNRFCALEVRLATAGAEIEPGRVFIAPGGLHTLVVNDGGCRIRTRHGPKVRRHRPSVDVLFRSVAQAAGPRAIGVIMTGMGDDGAAGLLEMKQAGARTIAQDEASSVVFGMPKEAIARRAVDQVVPLCDLPAAIASLVRGTPAFSMAAGRSDRDTT